MKSEDKNFIIMAVLLGLAGLLAGYLSFKDFRQTDTVSVKDFPRSVGPWVSEDIPLSKQDLAILETDNAFVRKYKNPNGEEVYLYIVYSQTNHKVTHPPEICYTGSGVSILEKTHDFIPVSYKNLDIKANRFLLQDNQLYQMSFYWFKVGNIFTSNYWKEQILVAFNALLGKKQGSALIRISADIVNKDKGRAIKEIKEFTGLIVPQLFAYLP